MPSHRDIAPFLQLLRNFLLGRKHKTAHRFQDTMSCRTQPAPNIPDAPSTPLSANYYYTRNARGQVHPPVDLVKQLQLLEAKAKAIAATSKAGGAKAGEAIKTGSAADEKSEKSCADNQKKAPANKLPTPGKVHNWD